MEGTSQRSFVASQKDRRLVFGIQVTAILIIIIFCLLNLTIPHLQNDKLEKLWVGLLGSCIGFLIPNPTLKNRLQ
jgi:hypothetical protein